MPEPTFRVRFTVPEVNAMLLAGLTCLKHAQEPGDAGEDRRQQALYTGTRKLHRAFGQEDSDMDRLIGGPAWPRRER